MSCFPPGSMVPGQPGESPQRQTPAPFCWCPKQGQLWFGKSRSPWAQRSARSQDAPQGVCAYVCGGLLAAPGREPRPRPLPQRQPPTCLDFSKPFGAVPLLGPRLETSALLFVKQSLFIQITAGKSQDLQDPWTFVGSLRYFCMNKTSNFPVLDPPAGAPHRASSPLCPQTFSVLRMRVKVSAPGAGVHRQAWAVSPCTRLQDPAHSTSCKISPCPEGEDQPGLGTSAGASQRGKMLLRPSAAHHPTGIQLRPTPWSLYHRSRDASASLRCLPPTRGWPCSSCNLSHFGNQTHSFQPIIFFSCLPPSLSLQYPCLMPSSGRTPSGPLHSLCPGGLALPSLFANRDMPTSCCPRTHPGLGSVVPRGTLDVLRARFVKGWPCSGWWRNLSLRVEPGPPVAKLLFGV